MGFSKWIFRNGLGSPGHTARTLVKLYQNKREIIPTSEEINNEGIYFSIYTERLYLQEKIKNKHSLLRPFGSKMKSILIHDDMALFVFAIECLETKQFRVSIGNDNIDDILDVIKEEVQKKDSSLIKLDQIDYRNKAIEFLNSVLNYVEHN